MERARSCEARAAEEHDLTLAAAEKRWASETERRLSEAEATAAASLKASVECAQAEAAKASSPWTRVHGIGLHPPTHTRAQA